MDETKHVAVLWQEALDGLHLLPGDIVVDATLGGGGHTLLFRSAVGETGKVVSLDMDQSAIDRFFSRMKKDENLLSAQEAGKLVVIHANFADISDAAKEIDLPLVDAIFADLGYSSDQIEDEERGLSFLKDGPLDMRLDQRSGETAAHIVNVWAETSLSELFSEMGDEECARSIARAIVKTRKEKPFSRTVELAEVVRQAMPMRVCLKRKTHPATKVFQALRIAVNNEYGNLEHFLEQSVNLLALGGRLGVISFHSGEDRIVKQFFRQMAKGCECPPEFPVCVCHKKPKLKHISRDPITASEKEISENPRSRSAKLRFAEKC
ncbi:MAG: 16S rRNA (cytosine(1402)-N(4))-methyltransferase RsmH [Candidatus Moranbacteria bacterium]|jgi:16S rRNA (cytosine1402-N4)-methyltransferase|nr:16S rRNA (cytosine(1402)-N(4))-methyltransferase RsmH [Candidatus Moranbacteria bacterium]MBP9801232.1 16S rRNA (cytosine(1402)-N(4))-methyltransferase RsmH [Candidatus Moranbacteria bacterium]